MASLRVMSFLPFERTIGSSNLRDQDTSIVHHGTEKTKMTIPNSTRKQVANHKKSRIMSGPPADVAQRKKAPAGLVGGRAACLPDEARRWVRRA